MISRAWTTTRNRIRGSGTTRNRIRPSTTTRKRIRPSAKAPTRIRPSATAPTRIRPSVKSPTWAVLAPLVLAMAGASPVAGQTLTGRVLDEVRLSPVSGVEVHLLNRDGEERVSTMSDAQGRFTLAPPEAGEYYVQAERLGYEVTRSPLLALVMTGTAPVDLVMTPAPVGLEGLTVESKKPAADQLREMGIDPEDLGTRFVTQDEIEAIQVKRDVGSILEWQQINGLRIVRPENYTNSGAGDGDPDFGGLCFSLVRARDMVHNASTCALPILDGLPIDNKRAEMLDPETLVAIAVLLPVDARLIYGTRAQYGAVLFFTKLRTR